MKKMLVWGTILAFGCAPCFIGDAKAADKGPTEIILQSTIDPATPPKPAQFPHGAHQARLECQSCHHSMGEDGKRLSYAEGQKIETCEACHNTKAGMPDKINTFRGASHALCLECHRKNNKPELKKCSTCHKK